MGKSGTDNMDFQKAFVISLEESAARRARFFRRARRAGLDVEWLPAVRGSDVDLEELRSNGTLSDDFELRAAGSLGTLLSHVTTWEKIAADPECDVALVFEDDVVFRADFLDQVRAIAPESVPQDWDMLWLGWNKLDCDPINETWGKPRAGAPPGSNSGHFAYLVRSSGIPTLRSILVPYSNRASKDNLLRRNFSRYGAYFLRKRLARASRIDFDSVRKNLNNPNRNQLLRRRIGQWFTRIFYAR